MTATNRGTTWGKVPRAGTGGRWPRTGLAASLAVAAAVLASGCGDKSDGVARLNPRSVPFLTGVPVPAGFDLVEKSIEDYESGSHRLARHLYRGSAPWASVREFYREQMPLNGWTRVSDQNIMGVITLRFEKPTESCTVQISPSGLFNRCAIQAVVMPLSRTAKEPPPRRPMP